MDVDLFMSILAMDSYNRGDGSGIVELASNRSPIGNAQIIANSEVTLEPGSLGSGFFSTAYNWNGLTIISYRGANAWQGASDLAAFLDDPAVKDVFNGWTVGAEWRQ